MAHFIYNFDTNAHILPDLLLLYVTKREIIKVLKLLGKTVLGMIRTRKLRGFACFFILQRNWIEG